MHAQVRMVVLMALISAAFLLPGSALGQAASGGTDYTVQAGDWLARIAAAEYGDAALYPAIVLATNAQSATDRSYATITDPWVIEPGWKLFLPSAEEAHSGLTLTALRNATYASEWTKSKQAPLVDGLYSEEIVPGAASKIRVSLLDRYAFGLDADGEPLAVAVLLTNAGGSGTFFDLVTMRQGNGALTQVASASLGDRTSIEALAVERGEIVVQRVAHGPSDPMCCPTRRLVERYRISGGALEKVASETLGPAITGVTWQWTHSRAGDGSQTTVSTPSEYTLRFEADGRFGGQADCNRVGGPYALDGTRLTLGPPIITTLALCPPGSLYDGYVQSLEKVVNYALSGDQLILMLDGNAGQMFFGRKS